MSVYLNAQCSLKEVEDANHKITGLQIQIEDVQRKLQQATVTAQERSTALQVGWTRFEKRSLNFERLLPRR